MRKLALKSIAGILFLISVLGALLFFSAGTFRYPQAWIYLSLFFSASSLVTLYLWKKDPALLQRRVKSGPVAEKEKTQQVIQAFASLFFIGIFVVSALDFRHGWSSVPLFLVVKGDLLVALGFYIVFRVFRENSFTSATIEVNAKQKVVTTGPYSIVRHPMYAGAFILLIGTPLALDSFSGLLMIPPMIAVIIWRLLHEEKVLAKELEGYEAYKKKVKYRIVPLLW